MVALLLLLTVVPVTLGQEMFLGSCPDVTPVQDFNIHRFAGRWYELKKYRFLLEIGRACNSIVYTLKPNNLTLSTFFNSVDFLRRINVVEAEATLVNPTAKLGTFVLSIPVGTAVEASLPNYFVISTDYDNYAVIFTCRDYFFFSMQNLWIITRSRSPDYEPIAKAKIDIVSQGINVLRLRPTNQLLCPPGS